MKDVKWKMEHEGGVAMVARLATRRWLLILVGLAIIAGASPPPFMTASCLTRPQTPAELRALENLRAMTHGGVLPAEDVVARIESDYPRTKTAGLARLVRARIKINAKDFAGAAALLDSNVIRDYTALGDYALFMRGDALEQAGRRAEARIVFEKLFHDYASSLRAREARLRDANLLLPAGDASGVPLLLKTLAAKDDPGALWLIGKAYEQVSDHPHALTAYRRIYFFAPASAETAEAANMIPRLSSSLLPATAEEAIARADRLYEARKYADANDAYGTAFARFPITASPQTQLRRGIAASTARKTPDAVAALSSVPASAGETRAEALYYLAQTYAHARQSPQARAT